MPITTIGLDLAKHWFQVHGVDAAGKVVVKRRLRRVEVIARRAHVDPREVRIEPPPPAVPLPQERVHRVAERGVHDGDGAAGRAGRERRAEDRGARWELRRA